MNRPTVSDLQVQQLLNMTKLAREYEDQTDYLVRIIRRVASGELAPSDLVVSPEGFVEVRMSRPKAKARKNGNGAASSGPVLEVEHATA